MHFGTKCHVFHHSQDLPLLSIFVYDNYEIIYVKKYHKRVALGPCVLTVPDATLTAC